MLARNIWWYFQQYYDACDISLGNKSKEYSVHLPELCTTQFTLLVMNWSSTQCGSRARVMRAPRTGVFGSAHLAMASRQLNMWDSDPPIHTGGFSTISEKLALKLLSRACHKSFVIWNNFMHYCWHKLGIHISLMGCVPTEESAINVKDTNILRQMFKNSYYCTVQQRQKGR